MEIEERNKYMSRAFVHSPYSAGVMPLEFFFFFARFRGLSHQPQSRFIVPLSVAHIHSHCFCKMSARIVRRWTGRSCNLAPLSAPRLST